MPFNIGLTGLNAASQDLETTGHNVSNASTAGFKGSRAEFADVFALSYTGVSDTATGSGTRLADVAQQFTQGDLEYTDNNMDMAINGQGFYMLERDGVVEYSRSGQFKVDKEGYVVNSAGQRLQGYPADGGTTPEDIQLTTGESAPKATTAIDALANLNSDAPTFGFDRSIDLEGEEPQDIVDRINKISGLSASYDETAGELTVNNEADWDIDNFQIPTDSGSISAGSSETFTLPSGFVGAAGEELEIAGDPPQIDPDDSETYNDSTSLTVYDSQGGEHDLSLVFQRQDGQPAPWKVEAYMEGSKVGETQLDFDSDGTLSGLGEMTIDLDDAVDFEPPKNATFGQDGDNRITVDFGETTQYGDKFSVSDLEQDGYATGKLVDVSVESDGNVFARFTNGANRSLGQVALANFDNPQGLQPVGGTNWAETAESGQPLLGRAGDSNFGQIQGGAYEASNVDIAEQLVKLITAQRNYQANAQVISTADTITQTIINIR